MTDQTPEYNGPDSSHSDANLTGTEGVKRPFSWRSPVTIGVAGLVLGVLLGVGTMSLVGAVNAANEERAAADAAKDSAAAAQLAENALKALLPDAVRSCSADSTYAVTGDGGLSLTIDNKGKKDYLGGLATTAMMCIFDALNIPSAVTAHMQQTTSLDGRQTETWDDIEVSWSYHPDRGMDSVVTVIG